MATVKLLRTRGIRSLPVQTAEGMTVLERDDSTSVDPAWAVSRIQYPHFEFSFESKEKQIVGETLNGLPERVLKRIALRLECETGDILTTLFPSKLPLKPKSSSSKKEEPAKTEE